MIRKNFSASICFALVTSLGLTASAHAESAADALLKATTPPPSANSNSGQAAAAQPSYIAPSMMAVEEIKLSSPLARQIFADWTASQSQNFEIGGWMKTFFKDQFEPTAHLWSVMDKKLPEKLHAPGRAAYLYSLYRLGAHQTFFDSWMSALQIPSFAQSRAAFALEETLATEFENWFLANAIQISSDQDATIAKLGAARSPVFLNLTAATHLRKGERGADLLPKLPVNSRFRPLLAQTAAVALAKRNDIANAARVLKAYYEPWLVSIKDPRKLAVHYLQIARLLYQAGSIEGAIQFYEKIPTGMPEYLTAREELTWCWLRTGNIEKLRGNLESLTSKALADHFQPEAFLVRSISNLKLCYYSEVEKDFATFQTTNREWARKIETNVKAADPAAPRRLDQFSELAMVAEKGRAQELEVLQGLSARSVSAVLPAVGPQSHWTAAIDAGKRNLENAKKIRSLEFRRQWKNDQITLVEAIRKMRFVKVELLSQVALLAARAQQGSDTLTIGSSSATTASTGVSTTVAAVQPKDPKAAWANEAEMIFPFDGVMWPDELFKLRSQTKGSCIGQ